MGRDVCGMIHSGVWHDSSVVVTRTWILPDSFLHVCVTWLIRKWDSCMRHTRLSHAWGTYNAYVWYDLMWHMFLYGTFNRVMFIHVTMSHWIISNIPVQDIIGGTNMSLRDMRLRDKGWYTQGWWEKGRTRERKDEGERAEMKIKWKGTQTREREGEIRGERKRGGVKRRRERKRDLKEIAKIVAWRACECLCICMHV